MTSESAAAVPPLMGQSIDGRYLLESQVGAGGLGTVYRAKHAERLNLVALKLLHDGSGDAFGRSRFEWEAEVIAGLAHPNIAAILDYGITLGRPYLVTEWLEGETLDERLQRGLLPLDAALSIVRQLLAALAAVHIARLHHGNLKPSNVFLERRKYGLERVKLLDFGLAQSTAPAAVAVGARSRRALHESTRLYASPEQRAGLAPDARSDVYAAGAMLSAMISARTPWATAQDEHDHVHEHEHEQASTPAKPAADSALQALIRRATAKDPRERFADAAEMLCELIDRLPRDLRSPAADQISSSSRPVPADPLAAPGPASTAPQAAAPSPAQRSKPSQPELPSMPVVENANPNPRSLPAAVQSGPVTGFQPLLAATLIAAGAAAMFVVLSLRGDASPPHPSAAPDSRAGAVVGPSKPRAKPVRAAPDARRAQPFPIETETTIDSALTAPVTPVIVTGPGAAYSVPHETVAAPLPPASTSLDLSAAARKGPARNPWLAPVPPELQPVRALVASGAEAGEPVMRVLHKYNRDHPNDARGYLLVAQVYLNRLWRTDSVAQFALALQHDPSARGAPEVLPALVQVIVHGRAADAAEALIEKTFGSEALPGIDSAAADMSPAAATRLSALTIRLSGKPAR